MTILAGEFLTAAKACIEEGIHPQVIIKYYRQACRMAKEVVRKLALAVTPKNEEEKITLLERCAATALNSKLISSHAEFFAKMVVRAVLKLEGDLNLELLGIKKEPGGSVEVRIFILMPKITTHMFF